MSKIHTGKEYKELSILTYTNICKEYSEKLDNNHPQTIQNLYNIVYHPLINITFVIITYMRPQKRYNFSISSKSSPCVSDNTKGRKIRITVENVALRIKAPFQPTYLITNSVVLVTIRFSSHPIVGPVIAPNPKNLYGWTSTSRITGSDFRPKE